MIHNRIEYLQIPDYKNYYLSKCGKCVRFIKSPTLLTPQLIPHESMRVYVLKDDICYIHTILAKTFLKNYYDLPVKHLDGNTLNNNLYNLSLN